MTQHTDDPTEQFLRFSRRSMSALLAIVIVLGGTAIALTLSPAGAVSRSAARGAWLIPVGIAIFVAAQSSRRGRRWSPDSPEVRTVMQDEWRRTNMHRASRAALIVVLIAQWPLALTLGFAAQLPPPRAAGAMATSTLTLGLATLMAVFLFLDRE